MVFDADEGKWGKMLEGTMIYPVKDLVPIYHSKKCVAVVANNRSLVEIIEMLCMDGIDEIAIIT